MLKVFAILNSYPDDAARDNHNGKINVGGEDPTIGPRCRAILLVSGRRAEPRQQARREPRPEWPFIAVNRLIA